MPASQSPASAARALMRLNTAYFQSKVLQSAVELGVFELLASGPATREKIEAELGIAPRLATEFLDALAGLGLLAVDGDIYCNSQTASDYLVPGVERYLGGTMRQHARLHYHSWGRLTDALRGESPGADRTGAADYASHYADLDRARVVMTHMDASNGFMADELAALVDWSDYRTFVDIGGARGNVAARLVVAHPHLRGSVFDLPQLEPLFVELMETLGTAEQVQFHGGDFLTDPLPAADVVIVGHVLIDWPPGPRRQLLDRVFAAVNPGGLVVIYDVMTDDTREPDALLQRMNSVLVRGDTNTYSADECRAAVQAAGFRFERTIPVDTLVDDRVVIASKPG